MSNRVILILAFILSFNLSFGQISTFKVEEKKPESVNNYDSTQNFLGLNYYGYIGQVLYVKKLSSVLKDFGYRGFLIDYTKDKRYLGNTYKPKFVEKSKYELKYEKKNQTVGFTSTFSESDSLEGRYFNVLDVKILPNKDIEGETNIDKIFLMLKEKKSGDVLYFEYNPKSDSFFPFITLGFFDKIKSNSLNKQYVFSNRVFSDLKDTKTGNKLNIITGERWKCFDVSIDQVDNNIYLLLSDSIGQVINIQSVYFEDIQVSTRVFTVADSEKYKDWFGFDQFKTILSGSVKIGMTTFMCRLAWGYPDKVNSTLTSSIKHEQWVYSGRYLYFENDILTAIQ